MLEMFKSKPDRGKKEPDAPDEEGKQ
jgi:hypothetical protein